MAGPDEMSDVQPTGVKRPLLDVESLQRKKFKTEELPLTAAQHTAIEDLLHAFKKKGGFDNVRKKIWAEFHDGEARAEFTKLLIELAESEIEREPELLSRERGKAATLIEGAVDRSDVYKKAEKLIDALASNHLQFILDSVRDIRRQQVGDELAAKEEQAGNKTDEDFAAQIRAKREIREREWQEMVRKQRELEEQEARRKAEEERKKREIERQKEEEERARRKEREEQRRAERERQREEERRLEEQREMERQERYERRRREERERYRDWDRSRDRDRSRTRDRDRDRDRDRERDCDRPRSIGYRSPRYRDSRREKSATPKEPTQAPPPPPPPPVAVDDKSLEEAALQLLLKEGEELAAKARQKPEFDFEEAEAIENGLKPPPTKPKGATESSPPVRLSMWTNAEGETRLLMTVIARIDVTAAGSAAAHGEDTHLALMMIVDGNDPVMLLVARVIVTLMIELPYGISELTDMATVATALTAEVGAGQLVVVMTGTGTAAGVEIAVLNARKIEYEIARVQRMNGNEIVIIALVIAAEIEIEIETGIESVTGTGTENAKGTGIGIIDVAVTILGLVHELDADDRALPPALEIETKIGLETETETEIESGIVIKNGIETETKNKTKAGSEKETVTVSGEDPSPAFRIPLENRLARDGVPPALLTSTAMCPQRAIGADPLEGGSDLQIARSEMIVEGSWRLIGTYPAASGNVKRLETERKRKRNLKKKKMKKGKTKAWSFLIAERMTAGYGNLAPVKGEAGVTFEEHQTAAD
ncbi:BOD1/SHG1 domain-containing protein [Aspergillus fischeri NRRL 181]|uniref:Arginine rich protein n=1 Tax=Neosartorya fischeri (strain ATCC 1020 / DSM 3700 / CBS 544.65 / FGSC A1164 / JCM 1740 / NRRL 181 / WB 181) TaxID=331117 RepID=A1D2K7_NEOFI|nr:arginine rich protein [Aspergillus fischeri NRRL 181]EAW22650.1 arginine rich protein [Aspergillus fischeri NRRL 181]